MPATAAFAPTTPQRTRRTRVTPHLPLAAMARATVRWLAGTLSAGAAPAAAAHASDAAVRSVVARRLCDEALAYLRIAEEVVYPHLRATAAEPRALHQIELEHQSLQAMLLRLKGMNPSDPRLPHRALVVAALFESHVEREARNVLQHHGWLGEELASLNERVARRRDQLIAAYAGRDGRR